MSGKASNSFAQQKAYASAFAALSDETRLSIIGKLCGGGRPLSISQLAEGSELTRQAVSKHLRVLENVGFVRGVRVGRERRYAFKPEPIEEIRNYLGVVSKQWDDALSRLKALVEDQSPDENR
jgi:DNA-binding transcriptional ArsR family regulator